MKRNKVDFYPCDTEVPVIAFSFPEKGSQGTHLAIADTGSEITIFDYDIAKANKNHIKVHKPKEKVKIVGLHSDDNTVFLTADITLFLSNGDNIKLKDCLLYHLNHLNGHFTSDGIGLQISAVLGSNFLNALNAKIDYKKKAMIYDSPCD